MWVIGGVCFGDQTWVYSSRGEFDSFLTKKTACRKPTNLFVGMVSHG